MPQHIDFRDNFLKLLLVKCCSTALRAGVDPYSEELVKDADRVFYFDEGLRAEARIAAKANQKSQTIQEAFS